MPPLCDCPASAALPAIGNMTCPENFGQVQKLIFSRLYSTGTTRNKFVVATEDPKLLASWTPRLTASDGTKVVITPFLAAPKTDPGQPKKYGGGNATPDGVEYITGVDPTKFSGNFLTVPQGLIAQLKALQCENLGVMFVDQYGRIASDSNVAAGILSTPSELYFIPVRTLFLGDKNFGGLEEPDSNAIEFQMPANWSDKLRITTPTDFDALHGLANA